MARRATGTIWWRADRGAYYVRPPAWVGGGKRRSVRGGATIDEAQRRLDDLIRKALPETELAELPTLLATYLADRFLPALEKRSGGRTKAYRTRAGRLLKAAELLAAPMRDVGEKEAEDLVDALRARGLAANTIRDYVAALRICWAHAMKRGFVAENPWSSRELGLKRGPSPRPVLLSQRQLDRIYARVPELYRPVVVLCGETGLRRGDVLALEWSDLTPDRRQLVRENRKTGAIVLAPLTRRARAVVAELWRTRDRENPRVVGAVGASWTQHARAAWYAAVSKVRPGFQLKDLRKVRTSLLVRAGVPLPAVADWMGHGSVQMVSEVYGHLAPKGALRQALRTLEEAEEE